MGISDEQKQALRDALVKGLGSILDPDGEVDVVDPEDSLMAAVLPQVEMAYSAGRMAGASKAGYRLVQKNLELSQKLRKIREYAESHTAGWDPCDASWVLHLLDEEPE